MPDKDDFFVDYNKGKEQPDQPHWASDPATWTPEQRRDMINWLEEWNIARYGGRSIRDVPADIREGIKTFFDPS